MNNIVAIYRVLYGEDYIKQSITSILPHVDHVYVVKTEKPWGGTTGVTYKGEWIDWPDKFDDTRSKVLALNSDKVTIIDDHWPTPLNQITHIVNDLIIPRCDPSTVVFIEPDHVFTADQAELAFSEYKSLPAHITCAGTKQVELWKTTEWRVPERYNRNSVIFYRINSDSIGNTGFDGSRDNMHRLTAVVHNFGFCISERVMRWKHLTAIAFSAIIGDSRPNVDWFENKWLNWHPTTNNTNLEISQGFEWTIPHAEPYVCPKINLD